MLNLRNNNNLLLYPLKFVSKKLFFFVFVALHFTTVCYSFLTV